MANRTYNQPLKWSNFKAEILPPEGKKLLDDAWTAMELVEAYFSETFDCTLRFSWDRSQKKIGVAKAPNQSGTQRGFSTLEQFKKDNELDGIEN